MTSRRLVGGARAPRMPISRSSPTMPRPSAAPKSGCRTFGPAARARDFALPPSRLALGAGRCHRAHASTAGAGCSSSRELVDTEASAASKRAQYRSRSVRPAARSRRASPCRLPAALGPVHALLLDLPTLDRRRAAGADAARGVRRSLAGPGGDLALVRRLELRARWRWRSRRRSSARRSMRCRAARPAAGTARSRVRVQLYGGALARSRDTHVLDGANAAAVQTPDGAWEVLQFANAELVGARTYELSRLLRGQRAANGRWPILWPPARRSCCSTIISCRSRAASTRSAAPCSCASSRPAATTAIRCA